MAEKVEPPVAQLPAASAELPTRLDEVAGEYGKNLYLGSDDALIGSGKQMIIVSTGFFATYFALLQFVSFSAKIKANPTSPLDALSVVPPILLIMALLFFIGTTLPLMVKISLDDITSISNARSGRLKVRYWFAVGGYAAFAGALVLTTVVILGTWKL